MFVDKACVYIKTHIYIHVHTHIYTTELPIIRSFISHSIYLTSPALQAV